MIHQHDYKKINLYDINGQLENAEKNFVAHFNEFPAVIVMRRRYSVRLCKSYKRTGETFRALCVICHNKHDKTKKRGK